MVAASFIAIGPYTGLWRREEGLAILDFLNANILAIAVAGGVSLTYQLYRQQKNNKVVTNVGPAVHVAASVAATVLFTILTCLVLVLSPWGRAAGWLPGLAIGNVTGVVTACALGTLLICSLWSRSGGYTLPCLYGWGAACVGIGLDWLRLERNELVLAIVLFAATYVMLTGLLWRNGIGIAKAAARIGIPEPVEGLKQVAKWLPIVNALQAIPWTMIAIVMVLGYADRGMRYGAALVPFVLAVGVGTLAQLHRRQSMQIWALVLATIAAVLLAWADIAPDRSAQLWLIRCIRLLLILATLAATYGGAFVRVLSVAPTRGVKRFDG